MTDREDFESVGADKAIFKKKKVKKIKQMYK